MHTNPTCIICIWLCVSSCVHVIRHSIFHSNHILQVLGQPMCVGGNPHVQETIQSQYIQVSFCSAIDELQIELKIQCILIYFKPSIHLYQINKTISRTNLLTSWYNKTNNMNRWLIMPLSDVMNLSVPGECHAS